jgi:methionine synthase I (cobalamin-dependent)
VEQETPMNAAVGWMLRGCCGTDAEHIAAIERADS